MATPLQVDARPAGAERVKVWRRAHDAATVLERAREGVLRVVHGDLATDVERVRRLAGWMDTRFSIAGIRFGLDGLIGLVPGVGDTVTALIGLYPLLVARRHGLGRGVQARIVGNTFVDWLVGLVPLAGDLFDVGFKANVRNLAVIERAVEERQKATGKGQKEGGGLYGDD